MVKVYINKIKNLFFAILIPRTLISITMVLFFIYLLPVQLLWRYWAFRFNFQEYPTFVALSGIVLFFIILGSIFVSPFLIRGSQKLLRFFQPFWQPALAFLPFGKGIAQEQQRLDHYWANVLPAFQVNRVVMALFFLCTEVPSLLLTLPMSYGFLSYGFMVPFLSYEFVVKSVLPVVYTIVYVLFGYGATVNLVVDLWVAYLFRYRISTVFLVGKAFLLFITSLVIFNCVLALSPFFMWGIPQTFITEWVPLHFVGVQWVDGPSVLSLRMYELFEPSFSVRETPEKVCFPGTLFLDQKTLYRLIVLSAQESS